MMIRTLGLTCGFITSVAFSLLIWEYFGIGSLLPLNTFHHDSLKVVNGVGYIETEPLKAALEAENAQDQSVTVDKISVFAEDIKNSTLGFAKIIALSLPERTDRRDALFLMSSYQGIKLDWMAAVNGESISRKGLPPGYTNGINHNMSLGEVGCWRSHLNALQSIVEEGLQSALIIEDDADWDIQLKAQLQLFAQASRELDSTTSDPLRSRAPVGSPYGDYWDLLWIGICLNPPLQDGSRFQTFVSEYSQTHYVYPPEGQVLCTYAYAVTSTSARTLFGHLLNTRAPIDEAMNQYCQKKECRIIWPQLISSRSFSRDSDIGEVSSDEDVMDPTQGTWNIRESAMVDMLERNSRDA